MSATAASALADALRLLEVPATVPLARSARFPDDITILLRLVAGDQAALQQAQTDTAQSAAVLLDAAEFYLVQVAFTPANDSFRVLAVNRDFASARIREHYRLLVSWLHPDRNADAWQTIYLDRVNEAWRDLREDAERADYAARVADAATTEQLPTASGPPAFAGPLVATAAGSKWLSARAAQRLPRRVLVGLTGTAIVLLAAIYLTQSVVPPADVPTPDVLSAAPVWMDRPSLPAPSLPEQTGGLVPSTGAASSLMVTAVAPVSVEHAGSAPVKVAPAAVVAPPPGPRIAQALRPKPTPPTPPMTPAPVAAEVAATLAADSAVAATDAPEADTAAASNAASAPALQTVADPLDAISEPIDDQSVQALLAQFRGAYSRGDLIELMALFTQDARNRVGNSGRIADEYRSLFASSQARSLSLIDVNWWQKAEAVAVVARFNAEVTPLGKHRMRRTLGDIWFDLRREHGELRIADIRHQPAAASR